MGRKIAIRAVFLKFLDFFVSIGASDILSAACLFLFLYLIIIFFTISTVFFAAPSGIGLEGKVVSKQNNEDDGADADTVEQEEEHYWGQALQYLDRAVAVEPNRKSKFQYWNTIYQNLQKFSRPDTYRKFLQFFSSCS